MSTTSEGEAIPWMPDEVAPAAASAGRASTRQGGVAWVWFRRALKASFAAGVVYYLAASAPLADILAALLRVHLGWLALALAFVPLSAWMIAARQKVLTDWQGLSLSVRQIMAINLSTRYYDLLLPGYVSGVTVRWPRMAQHDGKPVEALAAIVFNRYLTMLTVAALAAVFWHLGRPGDFGAEWFGVLLVILLAALSGIHPLFFSRRAADWFGRILATGWLGRLPEPLRRRATRFATAAGQFDGLPARSVLYLMVLSLIRGLMIIVSFVFLVWALGISISFTAAGWIRSLLWLAGAIPFSVMGVGIREVGVVILLQYLGVAPADAVALSMLLVGRNLAQAVAGGVVEARRALAAGGPMERASR